MKVSLKKIGNSKGIIIPASMIKRFGFDDEVVLEEQDDQIIIKKAHKPREGWEDQMKLILADDPHAFDLTDEDKDWLNMPGTKFDEKEWEW